MPFAGVFYGMQKERFIMIKTFIIESGQKLTEEQLKEVEEAKKSPIYFDEDCKELSPAMMKAVVQRNRKKKAENSIAEPVI